MYNFTQNIKLRQHKDLLHITVRLSGFLNSCLCKAIMMHDDPSNLIMITYNCHAKMSHETYHFQTNISLCCCSNDFYSLQSFIKDLQAWQKAKLGRVSSWRNRREEYTNRNMSLWVACIPLTVLLLGPKKEKSKEKKQRVKEMQRERKACICFVFIPQ